MEKVNVYDWDKTIFPVDSTVAFVRWCLRRHPGVIWPLLRTLALLPGYWLGKISKTAVKERDVWLSAPRTRCRRGAGGVLVKKF